MRIITGKGKSYGVGDGTIGHGVAEFLYRLSIVTILLSVTVWPQSAVQGFRPLNLLFLWGTGSTV